MKRFFKLKNEDDVPLMEKDDNNNVNTDSDSDDDADPAEFKKNDITLWVWDAVVLIIEHFQYYAILLSLSEHWGWPITWVQATSFTFLFNIDIWEFRKIDTGLFNHSSAEFISSSKLGFNYVTYLAVWAVFLFIIGAMFSAVYIRWWRRPPLHLLMYVAWWKRAMFLVVQFLTLPFGLVAARVFHCHYKDVLKVLPGEIPIMDTRNELQCNGSVHLTLMVLVSIIFFFLFVCYPIILKRWVSEQVFSNDPRRHEGYIQLKEAEYESGLDIVWDIGQYHLFSSFKRAWSYYNPLKFIFKLLLVLSFGFSVRGDSVSSLFWSSAALTVLFSLAALSLTVRRPFRVSSFNLMIIVSHIALAANALIGNFMVRPPWEARDKFQIVGFLLHPTLTHILVAINATWLILLLLWLTYLVVLNSGRLWDVRVWPRLSYENSNTIGDDTKRYLKAALKARRVLEGALNAIPLFAPIHELSHQVQVINAYCREAEMIKDPTHDTLIDLLDELIEAHNHLAPVSVFGLSGKNSIKETSEEFIKLMPAFKKRLKQREYDFILVPPMKRRLLLKMYIMSVFVGNIKKKQRRPEDEVTNKLAEALALFDSRSLDNYESGLSSVPSTSTSGLRRPLTVQTVEGLSTAGESRIDSYLENVDGFIGANSSKRPASVRTESSVGGLGTNAEAIPLVHFSDGSRSEMDPVSPQHPRIARLIKESSDLSSGVSIPDLDSDINSTTS